MNTTRISNFFVETRVVTYSESLILQGFPLFYVQPMHIRKHQNFKDVFIRQHHYMNTVFRYRYLDMLLQTLAVFCISAFDGGELHCKNGYIHPHSFENAVQKYIRAGRPPLFLNVAKNVSATALSRGVPLAEKDCLTPYCCKSLLKAAEIYCPPLSL